MGLFDDYVDLDNFQASGGMLGRLLSLPEMRQALYLPDGDRDQRPSTPLLPPPKPIPWSNLPGYGQPSLASQAVTPDLHSQYQALRPILGDRNAMLATVHPDVGKTMIAQALANRQSDIAGDVSSGNNGPPAILSQTSDSGETPRTRITPEAPKPEVLWSGLRNYDHAQFDSRTVAQDQPEPYAAGAASSAPYNPISDSDQSDILRAGITSDQSSYCRVMRNLCHRECLEVVFGRDAFGPYRGCVRACMHNAGCFDF